MARFSERLGYVEVRSALQRDELDYETRVATWNLVNAIFEMVHGLAGRTGRNFEKPVVAAVWMNYFKRPRDEQPSSASFWIQVKNEFLHSPFFRLFDLIEEILDRLHRQPHEGPGFHDSLTGKLNECFERNLVGYRLIGGQVTPIDSAIEVDGIVDALESSDAISGARHSLERALALLADRQKPDYANSIKESISAVEAVIRRLTGEQTLGAGIKKLKTLGVIVHPALEATWLKMYGWTSDGAGIRHGGVAAPEADQALAKYSLVTCSAFVSYLTEEARKAELI